MTSRVSPHVPTALDPGADAEFYRGLSPAERGRLLAAACRAGARMLRSRVDAERAAAFIDPLPESSIRALARLRAVATVRTRSSKPLPDGDSR
ncbi:MAG: hypothetical protein IT386_04260 [Deltaproteobacteria bacterium]|nr:hypothetical protein [Deltaproteobacteria bacterium]